MDLCHTTSILLVLVICISSLSGLNVVPQPDNLQVNILDGEVLVYWKHPVDAPSNSKYNVQMAKYNGEWADVKSCIGITTSYCDLTRLILEYSCQYKVRVQLVAGNNTSLWTAKKVRPNESELQPPAFTLIATSSSLSINVYQKPILRKLFPYGHTYTIYLEETEQDKTTTAYLKDDVGEEQRTKTFSSLQWGREYCVSIKVQGNGALFASGVSPKQCLQLPEREFFLIAVSSLFVLGVLAIIAINATIVLCYLRRPAKTPAALKSPASYWLPLSAEEGPIEVVTDKGWFLSSIPVTEVENCAEHPATYSTENNGEERRTSMDSGVSMESKSATKDRGGPSMTQDDSGCGSLGGPEGSTDTQTDYPLQEERTDSEKVRKREDSGLGLGCRLDSSTMDLDGRDSSPLKELIPGGNYRTQSPSAVPIRDDEEAFQQTPPDTLLAKVVTGYRAGPQMCICSGAGQCTWCHGRGHYGSDVIKQYRSMCIEKGPLGFKCDFVDSYKAGHSFSSYSKKSQMDTVKMDDLKNTFIQLEDTFSLLTTLPPLPLVDGGHDFNMNNVSLSLSDVQLKSD